METTTKSALRILPWRRVKDLLRGREIPAGRFGGSKMWGERQGLGDRVHHRIFFENLHGFVDSGAAQGALHAPN